MSGFLKIIGTTFFTLIKLFLVIGLIFFLGLRWLFGPVYHTEDLIRNYEKREPEILAVKEYFCSILPYDTFVNIEFEGRHPEIFHIRLPGEEFESNWNLKLYSPETDSILNHLNWTKDTLNTLRKKLKKANCISISGQNPVTVGWQRSLMSKYSYKLFDENLKPEQVKLYSDSCVYQIYKPRVVLEYGSGAIGSFCFPEFQRGYKHSNQKKL